MRAMATLCVLLCWGCGAVTEERASAMEERLTALEGADADSRLLALMERLSAVEARTADDIASLRKDLTRRAVPAAPSAPPAKAPVKTEEPPADAAQPDAAAIPAGADTDPIWQAVDTVLGVETKSVEEENGRYTIARAWLRRQVDAMASSGRFPKVVAAKKGGVQIKGLRPESLGDQLGFKSNDVITRIDGKDVNSVEDVAAALKAAQGIIEVTIKRRREESTQTYELVD